METPVAVVKAPHYRSNSVKKLVSTQMDRLLSSNFMSSLETNELSNDFDLFLLSIIIYALNMNFFIYCWNKGSQK